MNQAPTAIIYARVSSPRQAEDGLPIASQIEQAQSKADQMGARVLRVFRDDGISGRTSRRPAFQEAVAYCATMKVNLFIVWSTSRFARNKIDAANFKIELKRYGTRLVYVTSDFDTDTDDGWFLDGIFELVDERYSRQIGTDTKRSMMKNARDGFTNGGRVPFGYQTIQEGKRKRLKPLDEEAGVVRHMFAMYLQGHGTKSISMALNAAARLKRGTRWNKNTVNYILKNPVYAGFTVFNRRDHQARVTRPESQWVKTRSHEGIISEEDFMTVANIMEKRAPRENGGSPHSRFVFTGLLRCGQCGASMQTESATGRSSTYHYYNCRSALKGQGCQNRRIPAQEFDTWVIGAILDKVLTRDRIAEMVREVYELRGEWYLARARRRDEIVAELRTIEGRRDKLFELLELHGKDAPNLGDLTKRLRGHKARIEDLEGALMALEDDEAPVTDINEREIDEASAMMREIIATTEDPVKLRTFFSGFVERIVVEGCTVRVEYFPEKILKPAHIGPVHGEIGWLPKQSLLRTAIIAFDLPERWRLAA